MSKGTCSIEEFESKLSERCGAYQGNASTDSRPISERALSESINICAEQIAKSLDLWIPLSEASVLGVPAPSGVENDVYYDSTTDCMIKVNNLMTSKDVLSLFQRYMIHASLFPQTQYTLIGFTGFGNGSIYPILSQPYIADATFATHGEILDYMEALGFHLIGEATYSNGNITISDLRPRNVLKTPSGMLYVVDADFLIE